MNAIARHPVEFGKRRQERHHIGVRRIHHGGQLAAHIPPQGGIRLFINVGNAGFPGVSGHMVHHVVSFLRRQMAGFRHHHQYLRICLQEVTVQVRDHAGSRASGRKLHAGIQCTREVIRNHQQFDHLFAPLWVFIFEILVGSILCGFCIYKSFTKVFLMF